MTRLNTFARIAAVAVVGAGLPLAGALAEETGPHLVGSGDNLSVAYPAPSTNIVGGALVRTIGSGEGARSVVVQVQHSIPGRIGTLVGSGESEHLVYARPDAASGRG